MFRNIVIAFLVPLLGNTNPSGDAKKRQQGQTLSLLLEGDVVEPLRLVQLLDGLWVRRVGDVF